jgi:predicted phosphoribosyltransferase
MIRFADRLQAARLLSRLLEDFVPKSDVVVLALRQRAVPIALEITSAIGATSGLLTACPPLQGRTVILVDAGIDDPARDNAAIAALRCQKPAQIVIAAPVASREASREVARTADRCVCLATPHPFHSITFWYDDSARWARTDHPTLARPLPPAAVRFATPIRQRPIS